VQIILQIAQGKQNQQVARVLGIHRETVRQWRERWIAALERLLSAETKADDKQLAVLIELILADEVRPGTPAHFSLDQIIEIIAIACESVKTTEHPLSHWTPKAVAAEAIKRGIVEQISPRSVGRFLKSGGPATASSSILAMALTQMTPLPSKNRSRRFVSFIKLPQHFTNRVFT
jgi:putative transposase